MLVEQAVTSDDVSVPELQVRPDVHPACVQQTHFGHCEECFLQGSDTEAR